MKKRIASIMVLLIIFTGCLTSPYYAQIFDSRSTQIPFQLWTTDKNNNIILECAQASAHGGPYNGDGSYQPLSTITPSQNASYDPKGGEIYSAGKKVVIPDACWRYYNYPDGANYITVIRIKQNGSDGSVFTFDKAGLECMGSWIGSTANWFGWLGKNCEKKYINTGGTIRTVFLKAK
jgi:hypothetical protein